MSYYTVIFEVDIAETDQAENDLLQDDNTDTQAMCFSAA